MRITQAEIPVLSDGATVHAESISSPCVGVHTDAGLVGLVEAYPTGIAAEAAIRASLAPTLLARDPRQIDRLGADRFQAVAYHGWTGAELRALSAVDLAPWLRRKLRNLATVRRGLGLGGLAARAR